MLLSIDWLQLHCRGIITDVSDYRLVKMDYGTRQFKDVYLCSTDSMDICTICANPHSSILHQLTLIIKFDNELLYNVSCFNIIDKFLYDFNIKVLGLTRVDIACDFQQFNNRMLPGVLINNFMRNKVRKVGQAKYKVIGEQKEIHSFEYLRFGSESSVISAYLYNKTKEMSDKHMKRYISQNWESAGYDIEKDTWRVEFSIKSKQIALVSKLSGEVENIDYDYIKVKENVKKIFDCLQLKYFEFRKNTRKSNVTREKKLELFKTYTTEYQRVIIVGEGDGTRSDKIFLRKLEGLNSELRAKKRDEVQVVENLMLEILEKKGLEHYYKSRIAGSLTDRIDMMLEDNKLKVQEAIMSKKLPLVQYDLLDEWRNFN